MAAGFAEALREHSKELQALEGRQADEFLRLLSSVRERIQGRLQALGGQGETLTAFRLKAILDETNLGIRTLQDKAGKQFDQGTADAIDLSLEHVGGELDRLSMAFDARPLNVTIDAAKVLADPSQGLLASHFESSVARYGHDILNGVRQQLFVGLRTGDSFGQIVQGVASENGPLGQIGRVAGDRIVRTEISNTYGAAQHSGLVQAAKQTKGLMKTWLHVGSYRCDVCMPLHGTMRPLDGTWTIRQGKKTKEVAHAPAHPACVCRVTGMKRSWRDGLQKLGYLDQDPEDPKSSPKSL